MTDQGPFPTGDALDGLVARLLDCGGALSQMIGRMKEFEASGLSSPDSGRRRREAATAGIASRPSIPGRPSRLLRLGRLSNLGSAAALGSELLDGGASDVLLFD
jgi:hypothetical protein